MSLEHTKQGCDAVCEKIPLVSERNGQCGDRSRSREKIKTFLL